MNRSFKFFDFFLSYMLIASIGLTALFTELINILPRKIGIAKTMPDCALPLFFACFAVIALIPVIIVSSFSFFLALKQKLPLR